MNRALIETQDLKRGFPVGGSTFWALKGLNINIELGRLTLLQGRSGSGKTTLINMLGALDRPTGGDVLFEGESIVSLSDKKRDHLRSNYMGFVFQSVALVGMMTAFENVEFVLRINGYPEDKRKKRVEHCLDIVGLSKRIHHFPPELSGGEQQRVAIARAIAHSPKVVFADEPTAQLDTSMGLQVMKIFKDLTLYQGVTVVMTTHNPELTEAADNIFKLEDGEVVNEHKSASDSSGKPH